MGFIEWLTGSTSERPRAERFPCTLTAHYWNGGGSVGTKIKNISITGAYLYAPERWYVGTILNVTLIPDMNGAESTDPSSAVTVVCKVVRHGLDGIGVAFMFDNNRHRKALRRFLDQTVGKQRPVLADTRAVRLD